MSDLFIPSLAKVLSLCLSLILAANSASGADDLCVELLGENYRELWRGYKDAAWPPGWEVTDGVLSRTAEGEDLMTVEAYADFVLHFEWKISPGGNSGVLYRVSAGDGEAYFSGPEYQILDNQAGAVGSTSDTSAGSLYALYAPRRDVALPAGEWNSACISVRGNHVEHWLNGQKIVDCEMGSTDWNKRVSTSKFAEWPQFAKKREGHIVLQEHGAPVWYRKIWIRSLAPNIPRQ